MTVCIGYDPSSTIGGWAVAIDGEPHTIGIWKPTKTSLAPIFRLSEFDTFCGFLMASYKPDVVTVEVIRVSTSHDTTRSLSRFEGVFIARAIGAGAEVIEYQVGQARSAFFGEGLGTMSKEQAYAAMRARYPQLPWLPADKTKAGDGRVAEWTSLTRSSRRSVGNRSRPEVSRSRPIRRPRLRVAAPRKPRRRLGVASCGGVETTATQISSILRRAEDGRLEMMCPRCKNWTDAGLGYKTCR